MGKVLKFLLMLTIVSSQTVVMAQTRESCVTYDPNRTLEGFKQVILTWKDPFVQRELWVEYARLANQILQISKLEKVRSFTVTPDLAGMTWLMDHTFEYDNSYYKQSDYNNGVRIDNKLVYKDIAGNESNWSVLEFEDVKGMYSKIGCINPEDPKPKLTQFAPPVASALPLNQTLNLNLNISFKDTLVVKHTFDKIHLVFDNQPMVVPKVPEPYQFVADTTKTKWYQTTVAKVAGGLILGGVASYLIFKPKKTGEPAPATKPEDDGKPAGTPGFPAEDDGSPDGTPGFPATGDPAFVPGYQYGLQTKFNIGVSIPINLFSH